MFSSLLPIAALLAPAAAIVQPLNTTILGQYGYSPAVYPSPNTTGIGWEDALVKAKAFVAQLTLEEKANMVTGVAGPCVGNILPIGRLNFNGLCFQDGPLSIRVDDFASTFPAGVSTAATFDRDLMYQRGVAMGAEFRAKGAHAQLGPVAGPMGRSAYAGRNWEGFSPDPYLTGIAMAQTIQGVQSNGVQAVAKHYITNEQETQRNPTLTDDYVVIQESVSSNLDDRTLHELYLWPFADAVKAGVASIMCSYNRINGSYGCQNSATLNGILKGELNFQGYVVSDWGGTHSGLAAIAAGQDLDMPGGLGLYGASFFNASFFGQNVTNGVNNGTIETTRLDDMVTRLMTPYYFLGQDQDFPLIDPATGLLNTFTPQAEYWDPADFVLNGTVNRDVRENHGDLIRKIGAESIVLLKNTNKTLPLSASTAQSIAIFGNDAGEDTQGNYNQANFEYGTLAVGGGSGTGRLTTLVTPLEAIKARSGAKYIQTVLNNTLIISSGISSLIVPALPDVCLVFVKNWAEEGVDRTSLDLDWDGNTLVETVAAECANTVVVIHHSGIVNLPFASHPNVTAILAAHYPGEQSGNSLVDVLYGSVNPSAKLPYTIAVSDTDYNTYPITAVNSTDPEAWQSWFTEKLEIDYRYFDAANETVLYEFGFGLSYTTFDVADLSIAATSDAANITAAVSEAPTVGGKPSQWEELYTVTATLSNTGDVAGAGVPQLYLTIPGPEGTPVKQLRGFEKVFLEASGRAQVQFPLLRRDLSYWDVVAQDFVIPEGEFGVSVGFSSRDIRVTGAFTVL